MMKKSSSSTNGNLLCRRKSTLSSSPTTNEPLQWFSLIYSGYEEFDCQYSDGHTFYLWNLCEYLVCVGGKLTTRQCPSGMAYDAGYNSTRENPCGGKHFTCDVSTPDNAGYDSTSEHCTCNWEHLLS